MNRGVLIAVALAFGMIRVAQADIDPCEVSDRLTLEAASLDVAAVGDVLLVAAGAEGLMVFENSGDTAFTLVDRVSLVDPTRTVSRHGALLLAGSTLLDITDPRQPQVLSRLDVGPNVFDGVLTGTRAVVSHTSPPLFRLELSVFDVANPSMPAKIGTLDASGGTGKIAAGEGYIAYILSEQVRVVGLGPSWPPSAPVNLPSGAFANAVLSVGNYLYVSKSSSLSVYDLSDPAQPTLVAQRPSGGNALAIDGQTVVHSGGTPAFYRVDDPANPVEIGRLNGRPAQSVTVDSDRVVHAVGVDGLRAQGLQTLDAVELQVGSLQEAFGTFVLDGNRMVAATVGFEPRAVGIYDISNPQLPVQLARSSDLGPTRGIATAGDTLVGYYDDEVFFVDLSQLPDLPVLARMPMDFVSEIFVDGSRVIVPSYDDGITVLDISDPSNPVVETVVSGIGPVNTVVAHGDLLYAGTGSPARLLVIDISDAANPVILSTLPGLQVVAQSVIHQENIVYIYNSLEILAVDVTDPASPQVLGSVAPFPAANRNVMIDDGFMMTQASTRFQVFDVSDPSGMKRVAEYPSRSSVRTAPILRDGRFWALEAGTQLISGRVIGLLENPEQRVSLGSQWPSAMAGDQSSLYISGQGGNMTVLDRETLEVRSAIDLPSEARGIAAQGDRVTVTVNSGLLVFDTSDPFAPHLVGSTGSSVNGSLAIDGGSAAAISGQVHGFDLSDPGFPVTGGVATLPAAAVDATSIGTAVYAACRSAGLQVIDISDPYFPIVRQGFLPGSGQVVSVAQSSGRLYFSLMGGINQGTWILDVSRPFVPELVTVLDSVSRRMIRASDGFLYSADNGLTTIYDTVNPDAPEFVGEIPVNFRSDELWVFGDMIFGMDTTDRLRVFLRDGCSEPCPADLAPPSDELNFFDVLAFLNAFAAQAPSADIAAPFGSWDFFDVTAYLAAFNAGCPE